MSVEPFLKWAGGKRRLLNRLLPLFPTLKPGATFFEPFLGAGAVFFALQPQRAVLSDINQELMEVFVAIRDDVERVAAQIARLPYAERCYYEIRDSHPIEPTERAARFIYLNKTCFNGLYRVNQKGQFNVPFGRSGPNVEICNLKQLRAASTALKSAELLATDFQKAVSSARTGDFVYFDPPYTTAHSNNGFIEYNSRVFSWADQERLAAVAAELVDRGVLVAISNADHPSIIKCYTQTGHFEPRRIERWSTIASNRSRRFQTTELVLISSTSAGACK